MKLKLLGFAFFYATLICINPHLGPLDDWGLLDQFNLLKFWGGDRFYILNGVEQSLITLGFGIQPFLYYLVNALEFLALFYLLVQISKKAFENNPYLAFFAPIIATLTPGLPTAYLRLFVPERLLVLCFSYIILLDQENKKRTIQKIAYFVVAVISMLLKEPAFLLIGGLSFFRFLEKKERPFHMFIMLLSVIYFLVYLYLTRVIHQVTGLEYGQTSIHGIHLLVKNIFNYLLNDPTIYLLALPTWFIILLKKRTFDPYLSLIAGYVFMLLYLGIFQEYYLLPLLPLLIMSAGKYWVVTPKLLRTLTLFMMANSVLYGLGQISIYKNEPRGFSEAMTALSNENISGSKTVCYLGLNQEFSDEIILASTKFSAHRFLSTNDAHDERCDYLIDSPYNYAGLKAGSEWGVIHRYVPSLYFPAISMKPWIKYLISKTSAIPLINQNIFRKHDFEILRRLVL